MRKDQIDILVDLTLHMAENRMLLFARKPAPVQITWLGYPGTTGLSAIDYRISDPYLDPAGDGEREKFYSEKTLRLPKTFWCYEPMIATADVGESPIGKTANGGGAITFGCLNNFAKVTPITRALWIKVLGAFPGSRLILQAHRPASTEVH